MDYAVDRGINIFEAAEIYPVPPKPETQGRTESIIGSWLASRKARDQVMVATKVIGRTKMNWLRKDGSPGRQSRAQILEAVEGSLKRLNTDYVDLYQLHWPDRPMRIFEGLDYVHLQGDSNPIDEILGVLGDLVRQGKIRFAGLSNETPWGVMSFLKAAETHAPPRIVSIQNAYNLVNRSFETGLAEIFYREQVSLLAYSPLGQGYLSGKYEGGALPPGSRKALFARLGRYEKGNGPKAISAYIEVARRHGLDPAQMAIAFAASRPFVTSTIIGATTMDQLKTDIAAAELKLSDAVLADIEQVHLDYPNPCP
jgi:aryl-alcohol dehydrogenase-like predicted oxidoreductase